MTVQEAYVELVSIRKNQEDGYLTHLSCGGKADEQEEYTIEAYSVALNALEKQIPKKPIDVCTPVVTWGLCPICKGELNKLGNRPNRVFESTKYCPDCGQALDWSGDCE